MSCFHHRLIPKKIFTINKYPILIYYQKRAKSRSDGDTSSDNVRCQYDVMISRSSDELFQ
jgi:hypothetical protein